MIPSVSAEDKIFLVEKILKNNNGILDKATQEKLAHLKRDKVSRPVIYVSMGTSGMIAGAGKTYQAVLTFLSDHNIDAEVVRVGSLGLCSAEPLLDVQLPGKSRVSFHHATEELVSDLLNSVFNHTLVKETTLGQFRQASNEVWANIPYIDQHPFFTRQQRLLLQNSGIISSWSIDDYIAHGGYKSLYKTVLNYTPKKVCEIVEQSEMRGRGGGGFPTGRKWMVALNAGSDQKFLICNAVESDPGAYMNRALIEGDPHRLLEGIVIASYAIGASKAYIYLRSDHELPFHILENALNQARESGFIGENIFGSGFNLTITIRQEAGAFVCGEETALIASIEGRRGIPESKPPFPAEKGLFGHPTIVNNIETLANIPAILGNGPSWFKSAGTKQSRGTKLFSISGKGIHTGFIEVPMGISIAEIVNDIAGGVKNGKTLKAVQFGGPTGICLPPSLLGTSIGFESLSEAGISMGLGGIIILDEGACMVNLSRYFMDFLQKESCGKCIPCREGTARMLTILEEIIRRPREENSHETLERFKGVMELESLAEVINDTSLCGLGQNAPKPVLSSLKWFREEYEEHIFDRKCKAGVCTDLRTFYIDVEACNGCNICQKKCPVNAIVGSPKQPHFIIESKCTGCGNCFDSCKFNAIYFK